MTRQINQEVYCLDTSLVDDWCKNEVSTQIYVWTQKRCNENRKLKKVSRGMANGNGKDGKSSAVINFCNYLC